MDSQVLTAELEEGPWRPTVLQTGLMWECFGRFAEEQVGGGSHKDHVSIGTLWGVGNTQQHQAG